MSLSDGWVDQEAAVCQGVDAAVRGAKVGHCQGGKGRSWPHNPPLAKPQKEALVRGEENALILTF